MLRQVETLQFRIKAVDIMDVKDAYALYDTKQAIRFLFEQQFPDKELLFDEPMSVDPCSANDDAVVITVKGRNK